jgi:hypothetical protein
MENDQEVVILSSPLFALPSPPQAVHHFDPNLQNDPAWKNHGNYSILPLDPIKHQKEHSRVMKLIQESLLPQSNMKIQKIQVVWNRNLSRIFEGYLEVLQSRASKPEFQPSWNQESNPVIRQQIMERFHSIVQRGGKRQDGCSIFPVFHGTKKNAIHGILENGFAALQLTDEGYFGTFFIFSVSISS